MNLPEKNCKTCQLPFSWRKKWEKNWDEVLYCSDKCRKNKNLRYSDFSNPKIKNPQSKYQNDKYERTGLV